VQQTLPPVVERLLSARDDPAREQTWSSFVSEYSRLILHVARAQGGTYDEAMDRYTYVLEQLRRDDCRRIRGYVADGRGKFTTWLVVVVRRLCLDALRARYGRQREATPDSHRQRRDLADLLGAEVDLELLPAPDEALPDSGLRHEQLRAALHAALAALEPADRVLLRLRFQDDVPVKQIARILSVPSVFHVYRRINGVCDRLRSALHDAGIEESAP
jgi:RNA polymerase sigma factor (sigma-70 family)